MILRLIIVKSIRRIAPGVVRGHGRRSASLCERRHADNLPVYAGVAVIRDVARPSVRLESQLRNQEVKRYSSAISITRDEPGFNQ